MSGHVEHDMGIFGMGDGYDAWGGIVGTLELCLD